MQTRLVSRDPSSLKLGGEFDHVHYYWRPYAQRSSEARADYDRLEASLAAAGQMTNPLIIFRDHVLIGQRRCEIAVKLGWSQVPCLEILDDIRGDLTADRVEALRDQYESAPY